MFYLFASLLSEMAVTGLLQRILSLKSEIVKSLWFGWILGQSRNDIRLVMKTGFHVNTTFHLFCVCVFFPHLVFKNFFLFFLSAAQTSPH